MTFKALFVEIYYGDYSKEIIAKKINEYIENNEIIEMDFFELLDTRVDQKASLFELIQATDPSFSVDCVEAEVLAARYFLKVLEHYQNGQIRPFDLCRIFNNIEAGFIEAPRHLDEKIVYYPSWLGDLYGACDWCDGEWTYENSPHLVIEVKKQIQNIKDWLSNPVFK
jgi:hypothetical protein